MATKGRHSGVACAYHIRTYWTRVGYIRLHDPGEVVRAE